MLLERDGPQDGERARVMLEAAFGTCGELDMSALTSEVAAALDRVGAVAQGTVTEMSEDHAGRLVTPSSKSQIEDGILLLEGEYWTVAYEGKLSRLRDSKGLRVLAELLASPGRPHASLDLERLGATGDEAAARAVAAGDAGELIDADARREYRARQLELRAAIEDADAAGSSEQLGILREELDFITQELSRALGLGGRSRHAGSTAERARLNVTRAVKSALRRIEAADAALAAHLEATVRTGTVCLYTPDPRAPLEWRVSLHAGRTA